MKKDFDKSQVNKTDVQFDDIYGLDKAKVQLKEIIDYLKEPEKYTVVGARLRHGILLYGKPGTGKTMLAKVLLTSLRVYLFRLRQPNQIQIFFM